MSTDSQALDPPDRFLGELNLQEKVRPSLQNLMEKSKETVQLAIVDDKETVCVDKLENYESMRLVAHAACRYSTLHPIPIGRVFSGLYILRKRAK